MSVLADILQPLLLTSPKMDSTHTRTHTHELCTIKGFTEVYIF